MTCRLNTSSHIGLVSGGTLHISMWHSHECLKDKPSCGIVWMKLSNKISFVKIFHAQ